MDRNTNRFAGMPSRRTLAAFFAWLASWLVVSSHAGIIQNGSFESPPIAPNTLERILPTSWQSVGGSIGWIFNGSVESWPTPFDGNQFADIGNSSAFGISQILSIGVTGQYDLRWVDNNYLGISSSIYRVEILDSGNSPVMSETFNANHGGVWTVRSIAVSLGVDSYTLRFIPVGSSNSADVLLDNVSLNVASMSVPEPSCLLIGLGLFGPQLLRIRKTCGLNLRRKARTNC